MHPNKSWFILLENDSESIFVGRLSTFDIPKIISKSEEYIFDILIWFWDLYIYEETYVILKCSENTIQFNTYGLWHLRNKLSRPWDVDRRSVNIYIYITINVIIWLLLIINESSGISDKFRKIIHYNRLLLTGSALCEKIDLILLATFFFLEGITEWWKNLNPNIKILL